MFESVSGTGGEISRLAQFWTRERGCGDTWLCVHVWMPRALDGHVVTVHHLGLGHELRATRSAEVIHPGAHLKHDRYILIPLLLSHFFKALVCRYENLSSEEGLSYIKMYLIQGHVVETVPMPLSIQILCY